MPRRPAQPKPSTPVSPDAAIPAVLAKPAGKAAARPPLSKNVVVPSVPAVPSRAPAQPALSLSARPKRRGTAKLAPAGALPPARIPPESLKAPRETNLLAIAASISIAIHVAVLSIHFAPIVMNDWGRGPPLEVALVNAKSKTKPAKADIFAQANLDGGGNTDQDRHARSPLPVVPKDSPHHELHQNAQRVETLERQAKEVMAQLKSSVPAPPSAPPAPDAGDTPELPDAKELMQRTIEAMRLEAQIAKDMEAYQKRPKRRFVGARAEEYRFARYVEDWRLKIENIGNRNYPEAARREKLYGSLLLTVSIKSDGSVEGIELNRSSGHRLLDAAAVKIVEMSAPFAPFPPDIKRDTDILTITRTWSFTKGDELVSQ